MGNRVKVLDRLAALMEPYAREKPDITVGEVLRLESGGLALEAAAMPQKTWRWRPKILHVPIGRATRDHSIATQAGMAEVAAVVLGKLAVHSSIGLTGGYTLTHVPTGKVIARGMSYSRMKGLAEKLVHLDWDFTRADSEEDIPVQTREKAWVIIEATRFQRRPALKKIGRREHLNG